MSLIQEVKMYTLESDSELRFEVENSIIEIEVSDAFNWSIIACALCGILLPPLI